MKTLNIEWKEKDLSGTTEYTIVSEGGDIIYQTYIYETACAVLNALGVYNILLAKANQQGTKRGKNKVDIVYKYITEMQKKAVLSSKHSRKNTLNYFYGENSTVICSMTEIAVFPKHMERPAYIEEPEKNNYDKILSFFTWEQREILSITPVIMEDNFYYKIVANGDGSYRAGSDGKLTVYLDKNAFHFLLDVFGSIEEMQKNIIFRDSNFITFEVEGVKVLLVGKAVSGKIITEEDLNILNTEVFNNYSLTNKCSFVTKDEVEKHMIKAIKITDIKENLQAFFNYKKVKAYKVAYSQLLNEAVKILDGAPV